MYRCRVVFSLIEAGVIGMLAGMAGYVYILECTDKTPALLQAAKVFSDIDVCSFVLTLAGVLYIGLVLLYKEMRYSWRRWRKKRVVKESV